jgi:acetyl-CoA carboxylase carboxyltransferase component
VDEGDFFEIQEPRQEHSLSASSASRPTVGVVANQPMVLAGCSTSIRQPKAARFVRFCDASTSRS